MKTKAEIIKRIKELKKEHKEHSDGQSISRFTTFAFENKISALEWVVEGANV